MGSFRVFLQHNEAVEKAYNNGFHIALKIFFS